MQPNSPSLFFTIHVVLVRTIYPSNIGACSRAMSNMGAQRLILIDKKCEVDYSAQQAAASGQLALQNRTEYSSLEEFYKNENSGIRIALTARDGRARIVYDLKTTLEKIYKIPEISEALQSEANPLPLYLFFGPEDCGLSLDDIKDCHYSCSLPTYGENWSLNIAQAVLLTLFVLRDTWGGTRTTLDGQYRPKDIKIQDEVQKSNLIPDQTLKTWLEALGFDLSKKRMNVFTVLKRLLLHNVPSPKEIRILETVLQQNIRRLKGDKSQVPSELNSDFDDNVE